MKSIKNHNPVIFSFLTIAVVFISLFNISGCLNQINVAGLSTDGTVAVFYGTSSDKLLGELIIKETIYEGHYYNISAIQQNNSFQFVNESYSSIWWISSLALPIDLSFVEFNQWLHDGKGLLLLTNHFEGTPLYYLEKFGINNYIPHNTPVTGYDENFTLDLNLDLVNDPPITLNDKIKFNGSTSWVLLDNNVTLIAEVTHESIGTTLENFTSGIWHFNEKIIASSFIFDIENVETAERKIKIQGIDSSDEVINFLSLLSSMTVGKDFSSSGDNLLPSINIPDVSTLLLYLIGSIVALIVLIKSGITSRLIGFISGISISAFLFLAHVAYSPQKRRIDEDTLLDNEIRSRIIEFLEKKGDQGAHVREIQRKLECGMSSLLWHLQALDDFEIVTHEKIGKYHIFYTSEKKSIQRTEIALALKSEVAKGICRCLLKEKSPVSLSKIAKTVKVHHSSVQHHLKRLLELNLVIILKDKKRAKYTISNKKRAELKEILES